MSGKADISGENLSDRKRNILRHVIRAYVREVRPVSSGQLAKQARVSSATVRNELVALEELGFLKQLHTSGGRVPTDHAYRFFVEELVEQLTDTLSGRARVAGVYRQLGSETEALIETTLDLLTEMTGYVAWVSMPMSSTLSIRAVNFVEVDTHELLIVLVTSGGATQSRLVATDVPVKELELGRLSEALNNYLRQRSVLEVDYDVLRRIFVEQVRISASMMQSLQEFFLGLANTGERVQFSNMLQLALQPEFAQVESLGAVINALNNRDAFVANLHRQFTERNVQTIIGTENLDHDLHDCSLVLSRYAIPAGGEGTVGVLGPTRLLYERSLPWVKLIGEAVAQALFESERGQGT